MENNQELCEQITTIECEDKTPQQVAHEQAVDMVRDIRGLYPEIPESVLYTACLDYILYPDKTEEDFKNEMENNDEIKELQKRAKDVPTTIYGVEVLNENNLLLDNKDAEVVQG